MDTGKDTKEKPSPSSVTVFEEINKVLSPEQVNVIGQTMRNLFEAKKQAEKKLEQKAKEAEDAKMEAERVKGQLGSQARALTSLIAEVAQRTGRYTTSLAGDLSEAEKSGNLPLAGPAMAEVAAALRDRLAGPVQQPPAPQQQQPLKAEDEGRRMWAQLMSSLAEQGRGFEAQTSFQEQQPGAPQQQPVGSHDVKASRPVGSSEDEHLKFWVSQLKETGPMKLDAPIQYVQDEHTRRGFLPTTDDREPGGMKRQRIY